MTGTTKDMPDTSAGAETPLQQGLSQHNHFVSHGYRIHNEATYRGIDWLLNSTVGVASTMWASRTESGQKYFTQPITNAAKKVLGVVLKGKGLETGAGWVTALTSIMVGGFAIIPPMMLMEHKPFKKKAIRWMDEKIYGKDTVANDPRFEDSYRKIDEEPNKGFLRGMASRFIALTPILALVATPVTSNWLTKNVYDRIGRGTQWMASKVGIKPIKTAAGDGRMADGALNYAKSSAVPDSEKLSNWDFLHRIIGFDFGLTVLYSVFHEMSYKALSAMGFKKQEQPQETVAATPSHSQPVTPDVSQADEHKSRVNPESYRSTRQRPQKSEGYVPDVDKSRVAAAQHVMG